MAVVSVSALLGSVSGSVQGVTVQRGPAGLIVRRKARRRTGTTLKEAANRSAFGRWSAAWARMAAVDRAAWDRYAGELRRTNGVGTEYRLTGQGAFHATQLFLNRCGLPEDPRPPGAFTITVPPGPFLTISATSASVNLKSLGGAIPPGVYLFVYIDTILRGHSVRSCHGVAYTGVLAAGTGPIWNWLSQFTSVFGTPLRGARIDARFDVFLVGGKRLSGTLRASTVVV